MGHLKYIFDGRFVAKLFAIVVFLFVTFPIGAVTAQQTMPTVGAAKNVMKLTKGTWVQFRNYGGKQLLYFTHFIAWKCAIKQVQYSVNSSALDERFELPACNPDMPFEVDPRKDQIYLTFSPGFAKYAVVRLVFNDGSKSELLRFEPCDVDSDQSCAKLVE